MSVDEKSYWRLRVERLNEAGLCIHCGKNKPRESTKRCEACTVRMSEYQKRYYRKVKVNAQTLDRDIGARDGATFREIGMALGISRSRAEAICNRALAKLWRECKRQDIDPSVIVERGFSSIALCERWASE